MHLTPDLRRDSSYKNGMTRRKKASMTIKFARLGAVFFVIRVMAMKVSVWALLILVAASAGRAESPFAVSVKTSDGKPLPNTSVVYFSAGTNVLLDGDTLKGGSDRRKTDADGRFNFDWPDTKGGVAVACEAGFCLVPARDLVKDPTMVVSPWGRIEGVRLNYGKPIAKQRLHYHVSPTFLGFDTQHLPVKVIHNETTTDEQGQFSLALVPPVEIILFGMQQRPAEGFLSMQHIAVAPGTNVVQVLTQDRTITGHWHCDGFTNFELSTFHASMQPDIDMRAATQPPEPPPSLDFGAQRAQWYRDWLGSEAGRRYVDVTSRLHMIEFHADGTLIAALVKPGKYLFMGTAQDKGRTVGMLSQHVEIPEAEPNREEEPFDLGTLTIRRILNIGDSAPDFTVSTLDGDPFTLSSLRGKVVLLDFWATWCKPCVAETPNLKEAWNVFGSDNRFQMVSLSLDDNPTKPKDYVRQQNIPWRQLFLKGAFSNPVFEAYHFDSIPQILLIGPDGEILATDLRGQKIKEAVAAALKQ